MGVALAVSSKSDSNSPSCFIRFPLIRLGPSGGRLRYGSISFVTVVLRRADVREPDEAEVEESAAEGGDEIDNAGDETRWVKPFKGVGLGDRTDKEGDGVGEALVSRAGRRDSEVDGREPIPGPSRDFDGVWAEGRTSTASMGGTGVFTEACTSTLPMETMAGSDMILVASLSPCAEIVRALRRRAS